VSVKIKRPPVKMLRQMLNFMHERQRVYLKRQAGEPWPWTKDPILRRFRFCCVYRENDRVTKWIRENWREPYADHPNLWFALCLARQINWPDTLEAVGFPAKWDPRRVLRVIERRRAAHQKIYTSAYLLGGGNFTGWSKPRYTVMGILNPLWKKGALAMHPPIQSAPENLATLRGYHEWLTTFHGFGKFLAYEVVTDLRHTRYLCHAPDIMTWANIGPGAQRGLNHLYGREPMSGHSQVQLLNELLSVQEWITANRDPEILPTIEARDVEHSLCEYWKLVRAAQRIREGRVTGLESFRPPGLTQ
jgi:hypothetical protein